MVLEKRILNLERQVSLLQARIKANDLWREDIERWIYKTFRRSFVNHLLSDDSDCSGLEVEEGENVSEEESTENRPVGKRLKRNSVGSTKSARKKRARAHLAGTKNQVAEVGAGQPTSKAVNHCANRPSDIIVTGIPTNVGASDGLARVNFFNQFEKNEGDHQVIPTSFLEEYEVETHQVIKNETVEEGTVEEYSTLCVRQPANSVECPVRIRPDLQKYFEYCEDSRRPGVIKMACLIEGCNSKLSMHPTNRWANSVRHLGLSHKLEQYLHPCLQQPKNG